MTERPFGFASSVLANRRETVTGEPIPATPEMG